MKRIILKRSIILLLIIGFVLFLMSIKSNAASISISTSKSTVSPGERFTVTVSANGGAGYVNLSASNGSLSSGQLDLMLQSSGSVTCTAGSSGSITIYASGVIADYSTEQDESKSTSKTVQIVSSGSGSSSGGSSSGGSSSKSSSSSTKKTNNNTTQDKEEKEKSTDSSLNELTVAEGTISPEFNKDVKEYTVSIPYEVTEVNVTAVPTDSKATVEVNGNKELKEGENVVTITVTAEDGSKTDYVVKVIRKRIPLALQSLIVRYENKEGQLIELPLSPAFSFDNFEYRLEDIEYWIERLNIEGIANIEGAVIDIQGADNLQVGENVITITLTIDAEDQEGVEEGAEPRKEIITYKLVVNKTEKPTLLARTSKWFKGLMGTISSWYNDNQPKVVLGALFACIAALIGLSIYIVIDYNKYKDVIAKVKKVKEMNDLNLEIVNEETSSNINSNQSIDIEEQSNKNEKPKGGKHF